MKFIQHLIGYVLKAISITIALGLLLSYISMYISPAVYWLMAFFGLFFIPLVILNFVLAVTWGLIRRKIALVNAIALLPALLPAFIQINDVTTKSEPQLKIVCYNVHLFELTGSPKTTATLSDIAQFIAGENPDILCLQEVSAPDTAHINRAFPQYRYKYYCNTLRRNKSLFGIVTFSRFPIVASGNFLFPETSNRCIFTDLAVHGDTLRIYNNHLQSMRLNLELSASRVKKEELRNEEIKSVSRQLKTGFIKRAQQVNEISAHIKASPYCTIVCGDFNDTPVSYTYRKMKGRLNDCFVKAGKGIPSTYRSFWPVFRIDYIFSDPRLAVTGYKVPKITFSDHYPVSVTLSMNK